MKILKISEKNIPVAITAASILFILTCIIYFTPIVLPHKTCYSVGLLTIASLWLCPWQMTLALLFSAAGDYFGSCGNFLAQMGCFAVAHIWFITYFSLRCHRKAEHDRKLSARGKAFLAMAVFGTAAVLTAALTIVVPSAPEGILRIGTGIYACLICTMLILAMLQRSRLFALGAGLFVFSDFILAWNMFVEPVPYSSLLIMIPYYSAQWLLFFRSAKS